jgi:hypothetical protein
VNPVADDRANAITPHFACSVADDTVLVVEHDAETAVGQDLVDLPFEGEEFFFCQRRPFRVFSSTVAAKAARQCREGMKGKKGVAKVTVKFHRRRRQRVLE